MKLVFLINETIVKKEEFARRLRECCRPLSTVDVKVSAAKTSMRVVELTAKMLGGWSYTCLYTKGGKPFVFRIQKRGEEA